MLSLTHLNGVLIGFIDIHAVFIYSFLTYCCECMKGFVTARFTLNKSLISQSSGSEVLT